MMKINTFSPLKIQAPCLFELILSVVLVLAFITLLGIGMYFPVTSVFNALVQQLSIEQLTTGKFTFSFRCKFFSTHFPFLIHCLWSSQSLEFHPNVLLSLLPRAFLKTLLLIALQRIVFLFLKTTLVTSGAVPNLISL